MIRIIFLNLLLIAVMYWIAKPHLTKDTAKAAKHNFTLNPNKQ